MADRRSFDHAQATLIQQAVQAAVKDEINRRFGWKNGGSLWAWIKTFTPERVLLIIIAFLSAVFTLGGRAVKLETSASDALELAQKTAHSAAATHEQLTRGQEAMRQSIDAQAKSIAMVETMHATKSDIAALREALRTLLPRQEFQRGMTQQVQEPLKRLDERLGAIERQGRQP